MGAGAGVARAGPSRGQGQGPHSKLQKGRESGARAYPALRARGRRGERFSLERGVWSRGGTQLARALNIERAGVGVSGEGGALRNRPNTPAAGAAVGGARRTLRRGEGWGRSKVQRKSAWCVRRFKIALQRGRDGCGIARFGGRDDRATTARRFRCRDRDFEMYAAGTWLRFPSLLRCS